MNEDTNTFMAEEMTQPLRAFVAIAEDLGLVPSDHQVASNYRPREIKFLHWASEGNQACGTNEHMQARHSCT